MARPRKIDYPINLEELLRRIMPKKRPEDRMKIFREWAKANLGTKLWRRPTDEEFDAEWKIWCAKPIERPEQVESIFQSVARYIPHYHNINHEVRAKIAAKARWSKPRKKRKKGLERKKNSQI